jgi:molybdate transport system ATP-binding protein
MIEFNADATKGAFTLAARFEAGGGITALFGPSGAGKTTVLNLIAGLAKPDRGRISVAGQVLVDTETGIFVPPHKRRVGFVFQDAQLFPHLTVDQNLRFGRWFAPKGEQALAAETVIAALGIGHLMARRPARLSGGEKQRVALARALLSSPRLLLMDEPLAGLDNARKDDILPLIETVRDEFRIPMIYVTHAAEEVRRLASHVVLLRDGRVQASGAPADVLRQSTSEPA